MIHSFRPAPGSAIGRLVLVALCMTACTGSRPAATPAGRGATHDETARSAAWFCQMSPTGAGWECVRDADRARQPHPDRLPPAARPQLPERSMREPEPPQALDAPVGGTPVAPVDPDLPLHVRLAYRPPEPVALTQLPGEFYAVQVLTMASKSSLERFVEQEQLQNMSAARVKRDGRVRYVLLLGIYETRALAEQAANDLPPPFHDSTPWIRRLSALQADMRRAEQDDESAAP